jgi:hypothetical protein
LTTPDQPPFRQRVVQRSKDIAALKLLLEEVAGLLRQAVHVAGWLVLLWGVAALPFQMHPSLAHLITPGTGLLAVLQGAIPTWLRRHKLSVGLSRGRRPALNAGKLGDTSGIPDPIISGVACGDLAERDRASHPTTDCR